MTDEATQCTQATYDRIAPRYAARQTGLGAFRDLRAALATRLPAHAVVADLGCGPAVDGALLGEEGHHVLAADRSAGMAAAAAAALPGTVMRADLRELPLADASVHGIWCCAALHHVPPGGTSRALAEMRRVLVPGGLLALVTSLGDGARLEPVPYAPASRRWFFYRQSAELRGELATAGLDVLTAETERGNRLWLKVLARATRTGGA